MHLRSYINLKGCCLRKPCEVQAVRIPTPRQLSIFPIKNQVPGLGGNRQPRQQVLYSYNQIQVVSGSREKHIRLERGLADCIGEYL